MRQLAALIPLLVAAFQPAAAQQPRVAEVVVAPRYLRMAVDAEAPLVATAYDSDGVPQRAAFQWSSSNINVAEVSGEGLVRGIAQGVAVITAATGSGGARRYGQVTVFVRAPRAGAIVVPLPRAPATPDAPPAPPDAKPAPRPPPSVPSPRFIDSMIRASIDCEEPFVAAANPMRACYDRRPVMSEDARSWLEPPAAGACPLPRRPAVAMLLRVSERGEVTDVLMYAPTGCAALDSAVQERARRITFRPAEKEGRAVSAWLRHLIRVQ